MCPPDENLSFWRRLKYDYQNSYNRVILTYTAVAVTLLFISVVFDLKVGH
jgi:hypothetical protein